MKEYYDLFVKLSLQQCTKDDYADKIKVKSHNVASDKLIELQNEMSQDNNEELLFMLLNHEDDRVKVNAASFCLQFEILVEQAILTLKKVIDDSDDSTICFSAKMLLQRYK